MLQCHPFPNEYVDTSKPCSHCAFFMGLQRQPGVKVQENQQFDIRGTVDGFKHDISSYDKWKPGMDIFVSHVRRRQLPTYIFPQGYRRQRQLRNTSTRTTVNGDAQGSSSPSSERRFKRKNDASMVDTGPAISKKQASVSPQRPETAGPVIQGLACEVSFSVTCSHFLMSFKPFFNCKTTNVPIFFHCCEIFHNRLKPSDLNGTFLKPGYYCN